jgi:hypothetical protein
MTAFRLVVLVTAVFASGAVDIRQVSDAKVGGAYEAS